MDEEKAPEAQEQAPERVPWTLRDVVAAILLFFIAISGGTLLITSLLAQVVAVRVATITGIITGYILIVAIVWYFAIARRGADWQALGFRPFNVTRSIGLVLVWFFLVRILTGIYAVIAQQFGLEQSQDMLRQLPQLFGAGTVGFILALVVVVVIAPAVEELLFRGFVYPAFRERWGVAVGIIISGLLFALFHFNTFLFIPIALVGFALAYLYETTGSLGPPIMLHVLNNFLAVVLLYYGRVLPG